jgi:hypothetical protein
METHDEVWSPTCFPRRVSFPDAEWLTSPRQTEDADHPLALVDHWQPADLQCLHVPHRLGEVVVTSQLAFAIQRFRRSIDAPP